MSVQALCLSRLRIIFLSSVKSTLSRVIPKSSFMAPTEPTSRASCRRLSALSILRAISARHLSRQMGEAISQCAAAQSDLQAALSALHPRTVPPPRRHAAWSLAGSLPGSWRRKTSPISCCGCIHAVRMGRDLLDFDIVRHQVRWPWKLSFAHH
jgi:hypothetical protein